MISANFLASAGRFLSSLGLREFAELAAVIVAITGVTAYVYDRFEVRDTQRKQASLSYVEEYRTGEVAEAKRDLLLLWVGQEDSFAIATMRSNEANKRKYIRDVIDSHTQYRNDLVDLTIFFDEVSTCVEAKICDRSIIVKTLLQDIENHHQQYAHIICEIYTRSRVYELGAATKRVFFVGTNPSDCT